MRYLHYTVTDTLIIIRKPSLLSWDLAIFYIFWCDFQTQMLTAINVTAMESVKHVQTITTLRFAKVSF